MTAGEKAILVIQVVATVFIGATFVVYYLQLRAMRSASNGQNILSLVNFLQAQDVRDARRVVMTDLKGRELSTWSEEERRLAGLVCSSYDIAAILMRDGLVRKEPFIDNWGPSIRRCHEVLEPFIRELQQPENAGPKYWNDFGWLYQQVLTAPGRP